MMDQQSSFLNVDSINYQCYGCSKPIFSDVESDDEDLPDHLLDHFLDKSRSAKRQVITDRPCYHGRLETPIIGFNIAALQLSHDLLDNIEHIPKTIVFTEKLPPEDFLNLLGCSKDSTEIVTNIIVFKLIPEDIEDENPFERLYEHLIENDNFAFTKLKCELFSELYLLPLPKENEPPAFLPITSRLNLEPSPREDNLLLGVLIKKPPLEEGELSGESNQTPVVVDSSPVLSDILSPAISDFTDNPRSLSEDKPLSPKHNNNNNNNNNNLSPSQLEKIKSGLESTFKLMPSDRYGSYIGASTEDIPFLTDPVATLHSATPMKSQRSTSITNNNTKSSAFLTSSTSIARKFTEEISSDSEGDPKQSTNPLSTINNRKRTLPIASQTVKKQTPEQNKQQRASSSSSSSSSLSTTATATTTTTKKIVTTSENPAIVNPMPKKLKMSHDANNVIDLDSSESDPDGDLFPRQPNKTMTGIFETSFGDFEFKYHILKSDRPEVKKYLPPHLTVKGRARALDCEQCLNNARRKPNFKVILFQMLPRETSEDKRIFSNFAAYLVGRDRYGLIDYKPETYRAYVLPVVRGKKLMKAFDILKLKPRGKQSHELYGLIIKKSAMALQTNLQAKVQSIPSTSTAGPSSSSATQANSSNHLKKDSNGATESSEFPNTNLKAKYGPEIFPKLDVNRLANLIHSSVDDLLSLSANVANLLQKTTEGDSDPRKKEEATRECQSKVIFIMGLEEQQHAKRKKAYETILSWLKTLTS